MIIRGSQLTIKRREEDVFYILGLGHPLINGGYLIYLGIGD